MGCCGSSRSHEYEKKKKEKYDNYKASSGMVEVDGRDSSLSQYNKNVNLNQNTKKIRPQI